MNFQKKDRVWVIIANRAGARIFKYEPKKREPLRLLRTYSHPAGSMHGRDLISDRPGRIFTHKNTKIKHGLNTRESVLDHEMHVFAKFLAHSLDRNRANQEFDHLVLVSEPRFLGHLNSQMARQTQHRVIAVAEKNLRWLNTHEVNQYLSRNGPLFF